jgi:DNA ligase-1
MLAGKLDSIDDLQFPVYCTPKLDGIRCLIVGGEAVSRKLKPIPNAFVRTRLRGLPDGLDGELMVPGAKNFGETSSAIMTRDGTPEFEYHVFDYLHRDPAERYVDRLQRFDFMDLPDFVKLLYPTHRHDLASLMQYEEWCFEQGHEGVMLRSADGPYKFGRSTVREGYLLKLKRFEDDEAVVTGSVEGTSNQNAAEKDAFGRTKRSSAKAGKVGRGTLGALIVRDIKTGVEFRVGFKDGEMADELWANRDSLPGRIITYRHQPSGRVNAPRFPKFVKFREAWDCEALVA